MPQFTQLNLQGSSQEKPKGKISAVNCHHHLSRRQKTAAYAGSLVAGALLGVFLLESSGCSKGNERSTRAAIASPAVSNQPAPLPVASAPGPATEKTTQKKPRQHKLSTSTYKNPEYGISFRYPKGYTLLQADAADIDWAGLGPVEMNFVQPGGTTLTAVELPQGAYPGTDFSSAFFNVSVNNKLTAAQCGQFAFPQQAGAEAGAAKADASSGVSGLEPARVKLGAAEFTEVEDSGGEPPRKADAKYYHIFQNGACYEFALGVETTARKITDTPVNRNEVFRKLNWMLSTVKIEAAGVPAKAVPEVAAGPADAPAVESKN